MTHRQKPKTELTMPDPLPALKRAAKKAVKLARQAGAPAYVMIDGKIVDIAKKPRKSRKK
jgi:hypothetical protein